MMANNERKSYGKLVKNYNFNPISAACLEGRVEAVEEALNAHEEPNSPNVKWGEVTDDVGWSPLHFACQQSGEAIVDLLLCRGFPPLIKTLEGNTPLHLASRSGCVAVVRRLLRSSLVPLECKNSDGNTPLHVACQEGQAEVVKVLLECSPPTKVSCSSNEAGATPLGLAIQNSNWESARLLIHYSPVNPALFFSDLASHVPACSLMSTLRDDPLNIFVMGDANSGKSTFVRTLQTEGVVSRLASMVTSAIFAAQNVNQHRIGIVPTVTEFPVGHDQKHQVVFYDLAGHRDYTHEAIFECIHEPLKSLFVVTVDMRDDNSAIEGKILYWLNFVWQKCSRHNSLIRPNVLVIGTFADKCTRAYDKLNLICRSFSDQNKDQLVSHFTWLGNLTMNCRRTYSWGMNQLRRMIYYLCRQQEREAHTPPECYLLGCLVLTEPEFAEEVAVNVINLIQYILSSEDTLCKLLPQNEAKLMEFCHLLHHFSHIKFLDCSDRPDNCYLILKYKLLLTEISEKLCTPTLGQSVQLQHGILRRSDITEMFEIYPPDFITEFLESFKFCEGVPPAGLLQLQERVSTSCGSLRSSESTNVPPQPVRHAASHRRAKSISDIPEIHRIQTPGRSNSQPFGLDIMAPREPSPDIRNQVRSHRPPPYYFFPCLVSKIQPDPWESNDKYAYSFAWILETAEGQENQHFSPQFVTVLLFCLGHSFAPLPPSTNSTPLLDTRCRVWNSGASWTDLQGVEVCVSVHNNRSVVLSMNCPRNAEMRCLQLRNQIMDQIYELKDQIHPETQINEFLVPGDGNTTLPLYDPSQLPAQSYYSKEEIRRAVLDNYQVVCNVEGKNPIELDTLLYFEPSCVLDHPLREQLCSGSNEPISDDFCFSFAKQLGHRWKHLAQYYKLPNFYVSVIGEGGRAVHETGMEMLRYLRDSDDHRVHTYHDLRESLQSISIFKYDKVSTYKVKV